MGQIGASQAEWQESFQAELLHIRFHLPRKKNYFTHLSCHTGTSFFNRWRNQYTSGIILSCKYLRQTRQKKSTTCGEKTALRGDEWYAWLQAASLPSLK